MAGKIKVFDPRGYPPKVVGKRLANRPESLDGKVLYLIDCLFDNADVFMEQLRLWFAEHMPAGAFKMISGRFSSRGPGTANKGDPTSLIDIWR